MSLKSTEARKLATAGVIALSALGVSASSAQAVQKTLNFTCKYPLVDKKPLQVDITTNIPLTAKVNELQPAFNVDVVATAKDGTSEAISTLDAYKLQGVSEARASLVFPSGFVQGNLKVPLTVNPYIRAANAPVPDPLVLTASGKTPAVTLDEIGKTDVRLDKISLNLAAFYDDGTPINVKKLQTDFDGVAVTDSDGDINTFDVYCKLNAGENPIIASIQVSDGVGPVNTAPTKVTGLKVDSKTTTSANLSWTPSTDAQGDAISYNVYKAGVKVATVTTPSYAATGLGVASTTSFDIEAVDSKGAAAAKTNISVVTDGTGPVNTAPTAPTGLQGTAITNTAATIAWTKSTDNVGVTGYNVYRDGVKVGATTTALTFSDTGLTAGTTYSYVVEAFDVAGLATKSTPLSLKTTGTGPVDPTCPRGLACYNYAAKGSTTLKTLVQGTLPLNGDIKAQLDIATGKFLADLTLNNTSGRLTAAGFLPITAKVGFVPVGKTTGQLDDATATKPQSITTNSKVRIKVLEVKLFGAIPLAGGNSCQTKSLSDITLKSTNAFDPLKGGAIGGTFTISDLNGCGILNGIVSPLTAGGGNTISLNLTKY